MSSKRAKTSLSSSSFKHISTYYGVEEYELKKNGLKVLYIHDDTAPVAGLMVTYLVGSRHEATGHTGATHILEHMMFKGSKKFPRKNTESVIARLGKKGWQLNASTWLDRTNYYEVFPDEYFEYAVRLEADRMRNAFITKKDLDEERPAVLSEHAMKENDSSEFLEEKVWATAFLAHQYHHSTLGWLSDIENISAEKLKNFYDTYYHPNNAVVTVVGNIERNVSLSLIAKHFGIHKKSPQPIPKTHTIEPKQTGRRFVEVNRAGTKNIVEIVFKVPEALHDDTPTVMMLSEILGNGKTSRLYRALVDKKLASSVWSNYMPFYDPSLIMFYAIPNNGVTHEEIENIMFEECEKIVNKGVTKSDLSRVLAGVTTEMAFARDGHFAMLSSLNEAISAGDWRLFFDLPNKLKKVTTSLVRAVAKKYLNKNQMTVGYYRAMEK